MHKLVYTVFKTLAMSMIFIFIWDMGFYLFRVLNVDQRMKNYMTSMQKVIMENNYIPESNYEEYRAIFTAMAQQYNNSDTFIRGFNMNYNRGVSYSTGSDDQYTDDCHVNWASLGLPTSITDSNGKALLVKNTAVPAAYGDIMALMVQVNVSHPTWGWSRQDAQSLRSGVNWSNDPTQIDDSAANGGAIKADDGIYLTYTYYVPCLHYTTVY